MTAPRVTIGLPVFNGERYLAAAIDSVLSQTFEDFELIIADNASTDDSAKIASRARRKDTRVRVLSSDQNRGAAWNFNRLVSEARGEYFKWAAHDDLLAPGFLLACVSALDRDQDLVVAYTRAVGMDEQGRELKAYDFLPVATDDRASDRARSVLLQQSWCIEVFGVIRRNHLVKTNLIGPYTSSDRTLLLELAMLGPFLELSDRHFMHRLHQDRSMSRYDYRARNAWFDTSSIGRRSLPRWRLLGEITRAVFGSQVNSREKLRTMVHVTTWIKRNRTHLMKEAGGLFFLGGKTVAADSGVSS